MVLCANCKFENEADNKFCIRCGRALNLDCQKCGSHNPPEARFCGDCGAPLKISSGVGGAQSSATSAEERSTAASHSEPQANGAAELSDGERKIVTALFTDIKGSTALQEDLDPEEARGVIDPALKLMIDAVHHYDGYIVQSTGDGIFALFGAPNAQEDHPQRALYAALLMQESLRRYSARLREAGNPPIEVRVGVNTGEVVVRSLRTDEAHVEYTPIGHTTNLAARMQTLAPTGSVVTTDATRQLSEGYFTFKSLGPTRVKGVSQPVNVWEVTGLGLLRTRLQRAAGRGLTKFVGRAREMEALKHAAELALAGHGQVAAAVAEAGVGKSRLFFEFKTLARSQWMVLEGFSISHGTATAYLPVIELLRGYFEIVPEDDARKRREKVIGKVLGLDRTLEDTLPYLFAMLGIVEGDDPLAHGDPKTRRRRMCEALKRLLWRESLRQPLMLIVEDLHWVDSETQALLNLLVDSIGTARMLLLVNYRPEYRHDWGGRTYYTQLRLDPLGLESAEEMLTALLDDTAELLHLKRWIIDKTEGNPFFMEELVQALFEQGVLSRNGVVKLTKPLAELHLPTTVQGILASRIDRLPAPEKELLQTLAVVGHEFTRKLVPVVTGKSDEELEPMLAALQLSEFIYELPAIGDVEYTFKHALTQQVAYNSVLTERRRAIHERTGAAIETLFAQRLEDHFEELAHHFQLGNDPAKAVRYSGLAAEQAANRGAYGEATKMIETALQAIDKLPAGKERLRGEIALRRTESTVAAVVHGLFSLERQRAVERVCEFSEDLDDPTLHLNGSINLAHLCQVRGQPLRSLGQARRCLELAQRSSDKGVLAAANYVVASTLLRSGNLSDALLHYQDALRNAEQAGQSARVLPFDVRSAAEGYLSLNLQLLGRVDEALKLAEQALNHARESKHLFSLGYALVQLAHWHLLRREPDMVYAHATAAIALSEEQFSQWTLLGRYLRGWALAERGKVQDGVAEMEAGIAGLRQAGDALYLQFFIALLAQFYARLGRRDEALAMLEEALATIEGTGEKLHKADMLRLQSEVLLMGDTPAVAQGRNQIRAAIDLARAQDAKWWELRATVTLARLLIKEGGRDEARAILSDIYHRFSGGFDLPDLKDANALLEE